MSLHVAAELSNVYVSMELDSDWESDGNNPAQDEKAKAFAEQTDLDFDDALGYGYLTVGRIESIVDKGNVYNLYLLLLLITAHVRTYHRASVNIH